MPLKPMRKFFLLALCVFTAAAAAPAQEWKSLGPPGGDARVLAVDPARPSRVFLGTADGHIFGSEDSGAHWTLLGRASSSLDAVITAIVVDPRDGNVLFASSWRRDAATGGGVFRSADGGRTWKEAGLAGQAVRALAMAPSDSNVLVAGTLDGVYRSRDAAKSWERISPEHDAELRNLDSVAIDPRDPQILYAGTFHLPWKTADGGRRWLPIHEGMIDDSDVMSLLIDGQNSQRIYASACSGIYRSEDAAAQWQKIQGIPYTARRTYAITQDPREPARVYAATSEGLWKTEDAGMNWRRTTPDSWVVNTVVVTSGTPGNVLIGTEQFGVLASNDAGEHFQESNAGFDHRQLLALGLDSKRPGRIVAVLAHAPEPVLATEDGGASWSPLAPGLRPDQVLRLYAAPDGAWWASVTPGGLVRYDAEKKAWTPAGMVVGEAASAKARVSASDHAVRAAANDVASTRPGADKTNRSAAGRSSPLTPMVTDLSFSGKAWYAATSGGLLVSADQGLTWKRKPVATLAGLPVQSVQVSSNGRRIRVASQRGLIFSDDGGSSWTWHDLPLESGGAISVDVAADDENTLVAIAHQGLYISRDAGNTWQQAASGLPAAPVQDFAASGELFVASLRTGGLFVSSDAGRNWARVRGLQGDGYFSAVLASSDAGEVCAASTSEGLYCVKWLGVSEPSGVLSGPNRTQVAGEEPSSKVTNRAN
ncbi:MAG TPA: YCF48-related protein [Candidatus Acidoferrales bacterium]|nr:YCF48-related protein [Candidatus Acidoferrales bacterium]